MFKLSTLGIASSAGNLFMKHFTLSFLLFFLCSLGSSAQKGLEKSIDSLLQSTSPRPFNGVILIAKNGQPTYQKSHGYSNLATKKQLNINDQFLIASISKQFTAALVLQEQELGHLKTEQNIRHYLPEFKQQWADSVSVQQLLNHTSGITSWDKSLVFKPGARFSYSNINYAILGKIIEKTSGKSYAALTAALFKRCKMPSSTVPPLQNGKDRSIRLVKGHAENADEKFEEENILNLLDSPPMGIPATGMISTAADLTQWMHILYNGQLLTVSSYQEMIRNTVTRPHRWGEVKYGDGIQVDQLDKIDELSMSGYVPGFISTMIYYPQTKVSIVVLENISPAPNDMNRVFYFHDQIRKLYRNSL
ncbi:serine hydrolase domain-containing protein [Pedobacter sp.]|uniref:serine hydrolase domain-containing protein n=1 Tax=Pedobacter sp. TaxID=1411316 RepID=UPI003D7FD70E